MVHKQGGRIQELEEEIKIELETLGIIGINFYFGDSETAPRVEYQLRTVKKDIKCKELRKSLKRIISSNITEVLDIHWNHDESRGLYTAELELVPGFRLDLNQSKQHGLLSLAYGEIINHKARYKH